MSEIIQEKKIGRSLNSLLIPEEKNNSSVTELTKELNKLFNENIVETEGLDLGFGKAGKRIYHIKVKKIITAAIKSTAKIVSSLASPSGLSRLLGIYGFLEALKEFKGTKVLLPMEQSILVHILFFKSELSMSELKKEYIKYINENLELKVSQGSFKSSFDGLLEIKFIKNVEGKISIAETMILYR